MHSPELTTAQTAARRAAVVCMTVYDTLVQAAAKAGREPVTIADYASQAIINATLKAAFPDDQIMGEEHGSDFSRVLSDSQRQQVAEFAGQALNRSLTESEVKNLLDNTDGNSGRTWIVDPIDGTKGFLGKRAYAIAIALKDTDGIALGVLACPNLDIEHPGELGGEGILFYALRGQGAVREPLYGGEAVTIHVSEKTDELHVATSYESAHNDESLMTHIMDKVDVPYKHITRLDSQAKYGLVAAGRVTCYFRITPQADYHERVWDHAAGAILVQEAGGMVSDFSGLPLDFDQGENLTQNRGQIAASRAIHETLLAAIKKAAWA
ncbi:MAG: inositol monophosphatase family protein [Anaerolineae bacterium]|nr:inositol monophosphatase family protein [Anaerolineae bacterium]